MWLFTSTGYVSAVQDRLNPDTIVVRSRVRGDLDALVDAVPGTTVIDNEGTDYAFRVRLARADFARFVANAALDIDYENFKDAVTARQGRRRHDVYMRVWSALLVLQPFAVWDRPRSRSRAGRPAASGYRKAKKGQGQIPGVG